MSTSGLFFFSKDTGNPDTSTTGARFGLLCLLGLWHCSALVFLLPLLFFAYSFFLFFDAHSNENWPHGILQRFSGIASFCILLYSSRPSAFPAHGITRGGACPNRWCDSDILISGSSQDWGPEWFFPLCYICTSLPELLSGTGFDDIFSPVLLFLSCTWIPFSFSFTGFGASFWDLVFACFVDLTVHLF